MIFVYNGETVQAHKYNMVHVSSLQSVELAIALCCGLLLTQVRYYFFFAYPSFGDVNYFAVLLQLAAALLVCNLSHRSM
jgi:hypothetical protein